MNGRVLIFHLATFSLLYWHFFCSLRELLQPPHHQRKQHNNTCYCYFLVFSKWARVAPQPTAIWRKPSPAPRVVPHFAAKWQTQSQRPIWHLLLVHIIHNWHTSDTQLFAALQYVICPFVKCGRNAARWKKRLRLQHHHHHHYCDRKASFTLHLPRKHPKTAFQPRLLSTFCSRHRPVIHIINGRQLNSGGSPSPTRSITTFILPLWSAFRRSPELAGGCEWCQQNSGPQRRPITGGYFAE